MTPSFFSNFPKNSSLLNQMIQEFEYRKASTLTFFERCCAKKTFEKRYEVIFSLDWADEDFSEGVFSGFHAQKAPHEIKKLGFSNEWTKSLMYAYYFSLPRERKAFKNHILAGVVAVRPELTRAKPTTAFYDTPTSELGKEVYNHQCGLVWPYMQENALMRIAEGRLAPADQVVQVIKNAQQTTDNKNLATGVDILTRGLMPYFFRPEENTILRGTPQGLSYDTIQSISQKKQEIKPFLTNFAWLYLTQGKFYQDLELRNFLAEMPQRPKQMLLPLAFEHTRSE